LLLLLLLLVLMIERVKSWNATCVIDQKKGILQKTRQLKSAWCLPLHLSP
jgi:hypothetical protein